MFENVGKMFKKMVKQEQVEEVESKEAAKERLQLVLMQDRANVSADFLELMKQEIIDVIKKYIEVDERAIDVRLTTQINSDGTNGAPLLYANIPILNIKNEAKADKNKDFEVQIYTSEESVEKTTPEVATDETNNEENVLIDENILKELNGEESNNKETNKEELNIDNEIDQEENKDLLKDIDELYYDEDDEDDDDVTFDDLLKAAEEADAGKAEVEPLDEINEEAYSEEQSEKLEKKTNIKTKKTRNVSTSKAKTQKVSSRNKK